MRYIYNVTVKVDQPHALQWVAYMQDHHIADVMLTKCFSEYRFTEVMNDDTDGKTYSIQYTSPSREKLEEYLEKHAPKLRQEHMNAFGHCAVGFRTILKMME